jgi:hypothetical protein
MNGTSIDTHMKCKVFNYDLLFIEIILKSSSLCSVDNDTNRGNNLDFSILLMMFPLFVSVHMQTGLCSPAN